MSYNDALVIFLSEVRGQDLQIGPQLFTVVIKVA